MRINLGAHGHVCNGSQLQPKRHHRQWQLRLVVDDGTANLTAVPVAAAPAALAAAPAFPTQPACRKASYAATLAKPAAATLAAAGPVAAAPAALAAAVPVAAAPAALATRCVASVALARQERSYDH
jgi:hypothetical protein